MLPRVLKNFQAFVEGIGYAGKVPELECPEIKVKTEKYRAGGMDGEKEIDMGIDSMKAKMQFAEMIPAVMKRVALSDTEGTQVIFKGSIRVNAEDSVPVKVELHGSFDSITLGKWKSGEKADTDIEMNVGYYKLEIGGVRIYEIDVDNMVRIIGDTDVMSTIRRDIGL